MGAPHVTEGVLLIALAASIAYSPPWWCTLPTVAVIVTPHAVNVFTTVLALVANAVNFGVALWAVTTEQPHAETAVAFTTLAALAANPHFCHALQCVKAKRS